MIPIESKFSGIIVVCRDLYACTVLLSLVQKVHCTYCVPLCSSLIGPIVTIVTPVIRLCNHITVNPHTKCVESESVLSMTHVWRFKNEEIGPKTIQKSAIIQLRCDPSQPPSKSNFICKQSKFFKCFKFRTPL